MTNEADGFYFPFPGLFPLSLIYSACCTRGMCSSLSARELLFNCIEYLSNKGENHARNDPDCRHRFVIAGCAAHLAAQPAMGLFAKWRAWCNPRDSSHSDACGRDLDPWVRMVFSSI